MKFGKIDTEKKIEVIKFDKQGIQAECHISRYITNNFGFCAIADLAVAHLDPDSKKRKKAAKSLEAEVERTITRDHKGQISILARHIMDSIVLARSIAIDQGEVKISEKLMRSALRVEGIDDPNFCPLSFSPDNFAIRLDPVRQGKFNNKTTNTCFRLEARDCIIRFNLIYLPTTISESSVINLLAYCGEFIGIGAWTPIKSGTAGLFKVKTDGRFIKKNEPVKQPKIDAKLIQTGFKRFVKEEGGENAKEYLKKFEKVIPLAV